MMEAPCHQAGWGPRSRGDSDPCRQKVKATTRVTPSAFQFIEGSVKHTPHAARRYQV